MLIHLPILLAVALLPGAAWVLACGPTNRSRAASVGTMLALSPGLYGGAIAALLAAGFPLRSATALALVTFALIAVVAAWARPRRVRSGVVIPRDAWVIWTLAILVPALLGLFPLLSEWWRIYSDAWNHVGIVRAVAERGAHPTDPFFAGMALQYPTLYHSQMASLWSVTHVSVFSLMALWSGFALAALLLVAGSASAQLHRAGAGYGLLVLLFGLNALFPLFAPLLLAKAMVGSVTGMAEVARTFVLTPFGVPRVVVFLTGLGGQDFFLNKFMVATPFALGIAAYTAFTAALLRWLDGRDRRELGIIGGAVLAAGLMHPVLVLATVGATVALTCCALIAPRAIGLSRSAALALAAAVAAGAMPVALYTIHIMGGPGSSHRELPIDVSFWKVLGLGSSLALGIVLAVRPLLDLARVAGPRRAWAAWVVILLVMAFVIRTPGPTSFFTVDKFVYIVWIPLALTAAGQLRALLAGRRTGLRIATLLLLFVPVNGLALASHVFDPHARVRQPWDLPAFVWMRAHLPADAVVVVPYGDTGTGNLVGRDQYMSWDELGRILGYPPGELSARRAASEHLFMRDSLDADGEARLRALGRPVYAVWSRFDDPRLDAMRLTFWPAPGEQRLPGRRPHWEGRYPIVFSSDTHVVAELVPPRAPAPPAGRPASPR